jgi:hypothetical protein
MFLNKKRGNKGKKYLESAAENSTVKRCILVYHPSYCNPKINPRSIPPKKMILCCCSI